MDWNYFGGDVKSTVYSGGDSLKIAYPVSVSANLLKNPGFEKGVKYWSGIVGYPAEADLLLNTSTVHYGNHSLSVDVQTLGANAWDIQCSQKNIEFESGVQYRLSFWARAENPSAEINVAYIKPDPFFLYYSEKIQLSGEWNRYEVNYTATESEWVNLNIDFGFQTGRIYLDHFLLTTAELLNSNQVENGDFFDADSNWNLVTHSGAMATGTVIDGEYRVSISNSGPNVWDVHLGQAGIKVENGLEYTVIFDAYAASPRTISVLVGKNSDPWDVYHDTEEIALTTEKETFSYSFVMDHPSDSQARFGFDIGASTTDVYFDNIRVSSGSTPTGITEEGTLPGKFQLFQNYPNPFNPTTVVSYQLPVASKVNLLIYNLLGQKVWQRQVDNQAAGQHELEVDLSRFSSGVYFYRLEAGNHIQTKKMILLK